MSVDGLAPLPVAVPLVAAAVLVAGTTVFPRRLLDAVGTVTAGGVTAVCVLLLFRTSRGVVPSWFAGWEPREGIAIGIGFVVDPLGAGVATMAALLVTAALVFSWRFFETVGALFHALMLVFLAAMTGFALTGDLFNMFVFFELMSVAAFALTGYKIEERGPLQGALNFGITNTIGGFMILLGTGLLYGRTGALNLAQLGESLAGGPVDGLVVVAFTLLAAGFLVKAAVVPFHFWLADAHAVAPTPVCVVFSGIMVELGLYAVARIYWTVFAGAAGPEPGSIRMVLLGVGALTASVGAVMCFLQRHLKRLLAFSTVSHGGMFLIGMAMLSPEGLAGTGLYVLGHGLVKGALFICVGIVLHRLADIDEDDLLGMGRRMPYTGVLFTLGGLALVGLPPFGTWLGKHLIEHAAGSEGLAWVAWLFAAASILTAGAVLRAAGRIFLGLGSREPSETPAEVSAAEEKRETRGADRRTPATMFVPAALLLAGALAAGAWAPLERGAGTGADLFVDRSAYADAVLHGTPPPPPAERPSPPGGLMLGLVTALGAAATAGAALGRRRVPERIRVTSWRTFGPVVNAFRAWHSGEVQDYVAWLTVGVAALGGAFALALR
jgi:multicomponent Na+:H+ antiporter subunit D